MGFRVIAMLIPLLGLVPTLLTGQMTLTMPTSDSRYKMSLTKVREDVVHVFVFYGSHGPTRDPSEFARFQQSTLFWRTPETSRESMADSTVFKVTPSPGLDVASFMAQVPSTEACSWSSGNASFRVGNTRFTLPEESVRRIAAFCAALRSAAARTTPPAQIYAEARAEYDRKNYSAALAPMRQAAEQGHARAQHDLGAMYYNGLGVGQDRAESIRWYRRAAEQGNRDAQMWVAFVYREGLGVSQDQAEAFRWYRRAAEQGSSGGQYMVGWMYERGLGVSQDYAEAIRWYRRAVEQGESNGSASSRLGFLYENGHGVGQDHAEAIRWYQRAAAGGSSDARGALQRLGVQ